MRTEKEFLEYMADYLKEINDTLDSSTIEDLHSQIIYRLNTHMDNTIEEVVPVPGRVIWVRDASHDPWKPRILMYRDSFNKIWCYPNGEPTGAKVLWNFWLPLTGNPDPNNTGE